MNYDGIIFDLDGTLWTANPNCTIGWNNLLEKINYNKRITEEEMNSVSGKPFEQCIDTLLPNIRSKYGNIDELITNSEKEVISKRGGTLYPNVTECIKELSSQFSLYIISNCQEWYLLKFIQFSGLGPFFKEWDCHGASGLPKHIMIKNLVKRNNLNKYLYIGDTLLDKESSDLSGADFIQVTHGFGEPIEGVKKFNDLKSICNYLNGETSI